MGLFDRLRKAQLPGWYLAIRSRCFSFCLRLVLSDVDVTRRLEYARDVRVILVSLLLRRVVREARLLLLHGLFLRRGPALFEFRAGRSFVRGYSLSLSLSRILLLLFAVGLHDLVESAHPVLLLSLFLDCGCT